MSIESLMPSNYLILYLLLLLLSSIFPSIRVISKESVLHIRWAKYWSFSFSISPSNEYSGLISFRIDWLDLLAVQGTLKCLLQHHSSKAINSSALSFLYSISPDLSPCCTHNRPSINIQETSEDFLFNKHFALVTSFCLSNIPIFMLMGI